MSRCHPASRKSVFTPEVSPEEIMTSAPTGKQEKETNSSNVKMSQLILESVKSLSRHWKKPHTKNKRKVNLVSWPVSAPSKKSLRK